MVRIGVIGAGNIGQEVIRQAREKKYEIGPVLTTSGVYDGSKVDKWKGELSDYLRENPEYRVAALGDYNAPLREADVIFLAIPTRDNGEEAYKYMCGLLPHVPVITCEKGALSLNFTELLPEINKGRLGYRATVGGGTSLLKEMQDKVRLDFDGSIYAVINGTLNFVFDNISNGRSLGEAVYQARRLGYAEPGAKEPIDVINAEACRDVPRKSAIFFNFFTRALGNKNFISSVDVERATTKISQNMLRELVSQNRRYIVSIVQPDGEPSDITGGYRLELGNWVMQGGFRNSSDNPLYKRLLPEGVDNAILIAKGKNESKGVYVHSGPGAGAPPTVDAMMTDFDDMRNSGAHRS